MENTDLYDEPAASALCKARGCKLIHYDMGKVALVSLPSDDKVMISVGETTTKVFQRHSILAIFSEHYSWLHPKTIVTFDMRSLDSGWMTLLPVTRSLMGIYILYATLDTITLCETPAEISKKAIGLALMWPERFVEAYRGSKIDDP